MKPGHTHSPKRQPASFIPGILGIFAMPADPEKGSCQTVLRLIETLRLLPRYCPATAGPPVSKRGAIPARETRSQPSKHGN